MQRGREKEREKGQKLYLQSEFDRVMLLILPFEFTTSVTVIFANRRERIQFGLLGFVIDLILV